MWGSKDKTEDFGPQDSDEAGVTVLRLSEPRVCALGWCVRSANVQRHCLHSDLSLQESEAGFGVYSELRYLFPEILAASVIVEGGRQDGWRMWKHMKSRYLCLIFVVCGILWMDTYAETASRRTLRNVRAVCLQQACRWQCQVNSLLFFSENHRRAPVRQRDAVTSAREAG